jgi:hypothetical protein
LQKDDVVISAWEGKMRDSSIVEFTLSQILRRFTPQDDTGRGLRMTLAKGSE